MMIPTATPADQMLALTRAAGVALLARAFVLVEGADAESFLQNLLSQDLHGMADGTARDALFLSPKARIIANPRVTRLDQSRFLLDLEPVGEAPLVAGLRRYRLGAKVVVELTEAWSLLSLIGPQAESIDLDGLSLPTALGGLPRRDVLVAAAQAEALIASAVAAGAVTVSPDAIEALRVEAGEVRLGADLDQRWMPAEVGVVERTVSFEKGCFPGQEPVTRLHRRGHANRGPRRLILDALVAVGEPLHVDDREVGLVTSVAGPPWLSRHAAIGIVRVKVAEDAVFVAGGSVKARAAGLVGTGI